MKQPGHCTDSLIELFNRTFATSHNTRLVRGDSEPLYLPASNKCNYHRIIFAHGFYRSALHEIAHWCIAGKVRRQLADYGYWYKPDGRNTDEQRNFEYVESKPQALEWLFCLSAGHTFEVSADNLTTYAQPDQFQARVEQQLEWYLTNGLPPRAAIFSHALQDYYGLPHPATADVA